MGLTIEDRRVLTRILAHLEADAPELYRVLERLEADEVAGALWLGDVAGRRGYEMVLCRVAWALRGVVEADGSEVAWGEWFWGVAEGERVAAVG